MVVQQWFGQSGLTTRTLLLQDQGIIGKHLQAPTFLANNHSYTGEAFECTERRKSTQYIQVWKYMWMGIGDITVVLSR